METFSWKVDLAGASASSEMGAKVIKFGDGYEQRQEKGIAPVLEKWTVTKTAKKSEIDAIHTFIKSHKGVNAFYWRPHPDEPIGKWVAGGVTRSPVGGAIWRISFEMREVRA